MLAWDGKKGTGYRYIYGSLAMILPKVSEARRTYVALQPLLRYTNLISITCSLKEMEIEVEDLTNKWFPTVISVSSEGIITAGSEFAARRGLTKYIKEWNNEIIGTD